jgi:hypothetical protein
VSKGEGVFVVVVMEMEMRKKGIEEEEMGRVDWSVDKDS